MADKGGDNEVVRIPSTLGRHHNQERRERMAQAFRDAVAVAQKGSAIRMRCESPSEAQYYTGGFPSWALGRGFRGHARKGGSGYQVTFWVDWPPVDKRLAVETGTITGAET